MKKPNRALLALGEPNRLCIVRLLSKGPLSVQELANEFPISRPAVSKHLRILADANIIECRTKGTRNFYQLKQKGFDAIQEELDSLWNSALARFKLAAENLNEE